MSTCLCVYACVLCVGGGLGYLGMGTMCLGRPKDICVGSQPSLKSARPVCAQLVCASQSLGVPAVCMWCVSDSQMCVAALDD